MSERNRSAAGGGHHLPDRLDGDVRPIVHQMPRRGERLFDGPELDTVHLEPPGPDALIHTNVLRVYETRMVIPPVG